jgi:hypothetical protein
VSPTNPLSVVWRSKAVDSPLPPAKSSWRISSCLVSTLLLCISLCAGRIDSSNFSNGAVEVDFGNMTGGACNLCGPAVSNQYALLGVVFNNPSFPGLDTVDTNLASFMPEFPFPNSLYVYQGGQLGQAPAAPFQIMFSVPVTKVGFDFGSSSDAYLQVDAYGANNQLIDILIFVGSLAPIGLDGFAGIEESIPIARLDVSYHPNSDSSRTLNFAVDDLRFEGAATPEPSTLALAATGLLALALRRLRHRDPR